MRRLLAISVIAASLVFTANSAQAALSEVQAAEIQIIRAELGTCAQTPGACQALIARLEAVLQEGGVSAAHIQAFLQAAFNTVFQQDPQLATALTFSTPGVDAATLIATAGDTDCTFSAASITDACS